MKILILIFAIIFLENDLIFFRKWRYFLILRVPSFGNLYKDLNGIIIMIMDFSKIKNSIYIYIYLKYNLFFIIISKD